MYPADLLQNFRFCEFKRIDCDSVKMNYFPESPLKFCTILDMEVDKTQ
jgi:hypothetical protein